MRFTFVLLILVFAVTCLGLDQADARPVEGNRTLNLGVNRFSYTSSTDKVCDGDGDNCSDIGKTTYWDLGLGLDGGYMLTDMLELGLGAAIVKTSQKWDPEDEYSYGLTSSSWMLSGHPYLKVHLGSGPKVVPFFAGGLGLDLEWDKTEYDNSEFDDSKGMGTAFTLFAQGGVDYYLADKYGISGSLIIRRTGDAWDYDTDDDDNNIMASGVWSIRIGLGVATYY